MKEQRLCDYLEHILEAIDRILLYTKEIDLRALKERILVQDAVIRNFEVIGEACNNIKRHAPHLLQQYPDVPFKTAYKMRNSTETLAALCGVCHLERSERSLGFRS